MTDLRLMVCPHDTVRHAEGWYLLIQYLTYKTEAAFHFDLSLDFADFGERYTTAELVYANPADAMRLLASGYTPIAAPIDIYDEAFLVAGANVATSEIAAVHGASLATVSALLPTKLVLRLLDRNGVTPGDLKNCESWLGVVRALWNGDTPYGILYRDAYLELSDQGKSMVKIVAETNEHVAFHMFCASPKIGNLADRIGSLLLAMADEPEGRDILAQLGIPGWRLMSHSEINTMHATLAS